MPLSPTGAADANTFVSNLRGFLSAPKTFLQRHGGYVLFGACCLDVRTLTFCQLMGFPLNHKQLSAFGRGADFATEYWLRAAAFEVRRLARLCAAGADADPGAQTRELRETGLGAEPEPPADLLQPFWAVPQRAVLAEVKELEGNL